VSCLGQIQWGEGRSDHVEESPMIDGVLRILVIALGLLVIWWLCGPADQRARLARQDGREAGESQPRVDGQGR
jgi:hypothetical protein